MPTVLGLEAGLYLWALFAAADLAALVAASEVAFIVLRVIGAGFLLYLGVGACRAAWRSRKTGSVEEFAENAASSPKRGWWRAFGEGTVVMLANPKAAVFMIAFYPQFIPDDRPLFATTALLALLQRFIERHRQVAAQVGAGQRHSCSLAASPFLGGVHLENSADALTWRFRLVLALVAVLVRAHESSEASTAGAVPRLAAGTRRLDETRFALWDEDLTGPAAYGRCHAGDQM